MKLLALLAAFLLGYRAARLADELTEALGPW